MKRWFRSFPVFVMICMVIILAGCSRSEQPRSVAQGGKQVVLATDMIGRQVEVPAKPGRVITDRILPFPSTYFVALRSTMSEVVAMHPASKSAAVNSMLNIMAPNISKASTGIFNGDNPNIEEIMNLNPDLVFAFADLEGALVPYESAGITALGIRAASAAGGDSLETLRGWFEVLAYTGGDKSRMDAIIEAGKAAQDMIADRLAAAVSPNPSAIFIFSSSGNNLEIAGGNFFSEYWLKNSGAEDPAATEFQGRKMVNMEQIYAWNPDIIYITNFTPIQPEDIYENTAAGQDWSSLKAVQNKRVFKVPLGIYRWFPPSGDTPLMLQWLAQKNHPDIFTYSIEEKIKDYYKQQYAYELSDDEVHFILNPAAAAAAGYNTGR
ncbi:MAG: ABC transporter substrate-binding protein [Treponema sp.]|jgi:iron complex transport system substrate-binding protein|nr:ABC transporter substrate-binding protein [Treponema sp.]